MECGRTPDNRQLQPQTSLRFKSILEPLGGGPGEYPPKPCRQIDSDRHHLDRQHRHRQTPRRRFRESSMRSASCWQPSTGTQSMSQAYSMGRHTESNSRACEPPSTEPPTRRQCGSVRKEAAGSGTPVTRHRHDESLRRRHRQLRQRPQSTGATSSTHTAPPVVTPMMVPANVTAVSWDQLQDLMGRMLDARLAAAGSSSSTTTVTGQQATDGPTEPAGQPEPTVQEPKSSAPPPATTEPEPPTVQEPKASAPPPAETEPQPKAMPRTTGGQPQAQSKAASRRPQPPPSQDIDDRLTAPLESPGTYSVIDTFDSSSNAPTERISFHPDGSTTFASEFSRPPVDQSWIQELRGAFDLPPKGKGKSKNPDRPGAGTSFPPPGQASSSWTARPLAAETPVSQRPPGTQEIASIPAEGFIRWEASIGGRGRWDMRNTTFRCIIRCPARDIPPGNPGSFMCTGSCNRRMSEQIDGHDKHLCGRHKEMRNSGRFVWLPPDYPTHL